MIMTSILLYTITGVQKTFFCLNAERVLNLRCFSWSWIFGYLQSLYCLCFELLLFQCSTTTRTLPVMAVIRAFMAQDINAGNYQCTSHSIHPHYQYICYPYSKCANYHVIIAYWIVNLNVPIDCFSVYSLSSILDFPMIFLLGYQACMHTSLRADYDDFQATISCMQLPWSSVWVLAL